MPQTWSIYIGFDPREADAFAVTRESLRRNLFAPVQIHGLVLDNLRAAGLYTRPTERRLGRLWDVISEAPMATEFAISRFLVPHLAGKGLALFLDCDMLARAPVAEVFRTAEAAGNSKAVWCVKHRHEPSNTEKMDGQAQTQYARKNWSSFVLFNCDHPANKALTVDYVNSLPGRDLHRFCWLEDKDIGELGPEWNYLVGHSQCENPKVVHFTDGHPGFEAFHDVPYAEEWRAELHRWASACI